MKSPLTRALLRLVRVAVSIFIAGLIATYSGETWWLALAPVISAFFKYLRDTIGLDLYIV